MLVYWNNHHVFPPYPPPTAAPSSAAPPDVSFEVSRSRMFAHGWWSFGRGIASGFGYDNGLASFELPAPWFIYSFMGVGVVLCSISFIGCIAADALHGCCLCFYVVILSLLLSAEAALVAFIAIDHHWEQDLPFDPTGELDSLHSFMTIIMTYASGSELQCLYYTATLILYVFLACHIVGLSSLVTFVLRGLTSPQRSDYDYGDGHDGRARIRESLLNPQIGPAHISVRGNGRSGHSDLWSSLVREKISSCFKLSASALHREALKALTSPIVLS